MQEAAVVPSEGFASIADASKPNAGRIYDFVLGGNHNFEVDRLAAKKILEIAPFFPKVALVIRWFLGEAVRRLSEEGHSQFLDFASGLPTIDHIHQIPRPGTRVIYSDISDIDPITVAYGQEILKDDPNVRYAVCHAGKPEQLLTSPLPSQLYDASEVVAIGFNGICWFLRDEEISHAMKTLHAWAGKGSRLFLADFDFTNQTPEAVAAMKLYGTFGQPAHLRNLRVLQDLIAPWKPASDGFRSLEQ